MNIPNPNEVFPNEYKTSCFIKNVVTAPNISVGDYTYYDDAVDPTGFERNNVLFNYPEFGDYLVIGKFCQIASGTKFIIDVYKRQSVRKEYRCVLPEPPQ